MHDEKKANQAQRYNIGDIVKLKGHTENFKVIGFNYESFQHNVEDELFIEYFYSLLGEESNILTEGFDNGDLTLVTEKDNKKSRLEKYEMMTKEIITQEDKPKKKFTTIEAEFLLDEYIRLMSIHEAVNILFPNDTEYKDKAFEIMNVLNQRGVEKKEVKKKKSNI